MVCLSGDKVTICLRLRAKIVSGLERKKGGRANHHRPENLLADIKVVVREAAPLISQNAMVRGLGRELGNPATECGTLLHALEDEVDSIRILFHHPAQMRQPLVFLCARPSRPIGWESCDCGHKLPPTSGSRQCAARGRSCPLPPLRSLDGRNTPPDLAATIRSGSRG